MIVEVSTNEECGVISVEVQKDFKFDCMLQQNENFEWVLIGDHLFKANVINYMKIVKCEKSACEEVKEDPDSPKTCFEDVAAGDCDENLHTSVGEDINSGCGGAGGSGGNGE